MKEWEMKMFACCPFHLPPGKSKHFWSVALNPLVEQGEEMDSRSNHTYSVLHTNSMSVMATHTQIYQAHSGHDDQ